jgi:hypothetical protein
LHILVSTPGFVICHNTSSGNSEILESGRGNYYGITWSPAGLEVVLSHSGVDEQSLVDLASYAISEQGYLTIGGHSTWQFLSAPHQILWIDDMIVVTNTGRNALAKVNPRDHSIVQYRYDTVIWDRLSSTSHDGAHLNSLYRNGDTLYAVAHNFNKGSYILELDWPTLKEKRRRPVRNATGIHNLWIDETGRFITCDSNNGTLIDADNADVLWSSNQRQSYARGLAATDEIILVGHSDRSARTDRRSSETGLWLLNRDFRTLDYQYLGHFGAVQEVRIIDAPDLCHHGKPLSAEALDGLRARSRQISEARLTRVHADRSFADEWRVALGTPRFAEPRTLASADDELLVYVARAPGSGISGTLNWNVGAGAGHASLVVGYDGPEDQNMAAALFEQSNSGELSVSIWINNGEWKRLCGRRVGANAIRSEDRTSRQIQADFQHDGSNLELKLWNEPFLSAPAGDLPDGEHVGIRLLGQLFEFRDVRFRSIAGPSNDAL